MIGKRSALLLASLATIACSSEDVVLGGGRLIDEASESDGGARWDGSSGDDWQSSRNDRDRRDDRTRSNGSDASWQGSDTGDAGGEGLAECDRDGPYCTDDGRVFADECDARREGVTDATYCPWANDP